MIDCKKLRLYDIRHNVYCGRILSIIIADELLNISGLFTYRVYYYKINYNFVQGRGVSNLAIFLHTS